MKIIFEMLKRIILSQFALVTKQFEQTIFFLDIMPCQTLSNMPEEEQQSLF